MYIVLWIAVSVTLLFISAFGFGDADAFDVIKTLTLSDVVLIFGMASILWKLDTIVDELKAFRKRRNE